MLPGLQNSMYMHVHPQIPGALECPKNTRSCYIVKKKQKCPVYLYKEPSQQQQQRFYRHHPAGFYGADAITLYFQGIK